MPSSAAASSSSSGVPVSSASGSHDDVLPQSLARVIKKFGYDLIRSAGELPAHVPDVRHAPVLPVKATYSPWLTDEEFDRTFKEVSSNTLVDLFRCYELWSLVGQSAKLAPGALIEIGVWRGGTGCLIARAAARAGIADRVYLCDTFEGVVKAGDMDTVYKGGEHKDTSQEMVADLARRMGLPSVRILKGIFPDQTAHSIGEPTFRFAHVDVDVYQSTKDILAWIWPRLVMGGIVVFDDYGTHGCEGVTRMVNELASNADTQFIHNLNGHAILTKSPNGPEASVA